MNKTDQICLLRGLQSRRGEGQAQGDRAGPGCWFGWHGPPQEKMVYCLELSRRKEPHGIQREHAGCRVGIVGEPQEWSQTLCARGPAEGLRSQGIHGHRDLGSGPSSAPPGCRDGGFNAQCLSVFPLDSEHNKCSASTSMISSLSLTPWPSGSAPILFLGHQGTQKEVRRSRAQTHWSV